MPAPELSDEQIELIGRMKYEGATVVLGVEDNRRLVCIVTPDGLVVYKLPEAGAIVYAVPKALMPKFLEVTPASPAMDEIRAAWTKVRPQ